MPRFSRLTRSVLRRLMQAVVCGYLAATPALAKDPAGWRRLPEPVPSEVQDANSQQSIEDLLHERLEREKARFTSIVQPDLVRIEANYIRTAGSGEVILHESSFHLEPRYRAFTAEGRDSMTSINRSTSPQPVMYFLGYARTPLALPLVSNLSDALKGDEATYTVQIGVLPLPKPITATHDSTTFYVIIERAIESNRSESMVNIERFAKEFTVREGEPVQLRLENTPPEKQAYIIKLEDNSILDFYEDFARYFTEHIWLNTERLHFKLGKAELSPVTTRLSIPYTVARTARVKVELRSVIDSLPSLEIIDTVKNPADYLAEVDMKQMHNGPYRYRFVANELLTNKPLFDETHDFVKRSPIVIPPPQRLAGTDTLEVGGKRENLRALLQSKVHELALAHAKTERLDHTLDITAREKAELEALLRARQAASIAGIRMRSGIGFGKSSGSHAFVGIEAKSPSIALDVSFGVLHNFMGDAPFVSYEAPENFSRTFNSPKSLGLQLSYIPFKWLDNWLQPTIGIGYYGIWSNTARSGELRSATLLSPTLGFTLLPGGEDGRFGMTLVPVGATIGLGIPNASEYEASFKAYLRF